MYSREPYPASPGTGPSRRTAKETLYLPNLIAGLVAGAGVIIGSIGPWVNVLFVSGNGLEVDGKFTLALGGVAALILFTMVSSSRELPAPVPWLVPAVALLSLIIAMVDIGEVLRLRQEDGADEFGVQVGWGLWLVALSSAVLCITSTLVAARSSTARTWGVAAVVAVALLGLAGSIWLWPRIGNDPQTPQTAFDNWDIDTTTGAGTPSPSAVPTPQLPRIAVPAYADACPSVRPTSELPNSAVANSVTSCEFAEQVRLAYLDQPGRARMVSLSARSPVTGQTYQMTCQGDAVVECKGGIDALVYLY